MEIIAVVSDGISALHAGEDLKPDLILLEADLPVLSGIEVAHQLQKLTSPPIIVFMTIEPGCGVDQAFEVVTQGRSREMGPRELLLAIRSLLSGEKHAEAESFPPPAFSTANPTHA